MHCSRITTNSLHKFIGAILVAENRVVRRIFGPKRDEVVGGWRKLHN
jgi:hypothetical protein